MTHGRVPRGGLPITRRMVARDAARFAITIAGVGMAVLLMLFLLALHDGVRTEANGWVSSRPADAWVTQAGATNFIKATSFLPSALGDSLRADESVAEVTPLLRLITQIEGPRRTVTAILIGVDPASAMGLPAVTAGRAAPRDGGIVLDRALAHRLGAGLGDTLVVEGRRLRVAGLSRGTNSVLTQYAFIALDEARALSSVPDLASFFLVSGRDGVPAGSLAARLRARAPRAAVWTRAHFAANTMDELRAGLIPILVSLIVLGSLVTWVILTLLLYGAVLERREDYAVLKAIGAPTGFLVRLVLGQALAAVIGGLLLGLAAYAALAPLMSAVAPAVPVALSGAAVAWVAAGALLTGALGALLPLARIAGIHPAEVFRA